MARTYLRGGHKLDRFIKEAKAAMRIKGVEVGFFDTARYPDGTAVTNVAAAHEFGLGVPERPFFRQALKGADKELLQVLKVSLDPKKMAVDERVGGRLGLALQNRIQRRITDLKRPANAPSTIAMKGSSNPLIDTGFMRASVTYEVVK